ncbi:MAG: metalloregulator ArsR/SmtB family transcription factor [Planctomycetota bacterium]|nr:metalloregulator ArsR/SmtB family transcription factor [Planctomycetota bacterium]
MTVTQIALNECQHQRIAKAIADPQRFAILTVIARHDEIPCKSLVAEFPITQATISHHLKELVAADLIHSRREGQLAILSCRRDVCDAFTQWLNETLVDPGKLPKCLHP